MAGANPGQTISRLGGFIGSSDGSIDVEGGPAQGQIDLKLAATGGGGALPVIFESAEIDLTALGATAVVFPGSFPGKVPSLSTLRMLSNRSAGTVTTTPVFKMGTNGAHDNLATGITTVSAATFNAGPAIGSSQVIAPSLSGLPDLGAPLIIEVTTAAVGAGLALAGRFAFVVTPADPP